jgi:crotonobetainyl-CoA:carnitine CoA-transferase CaiB-like acyl-CoA transferase
LPPEYKLAEFVLEGGSPRALNVPAGSYQTLDGWLMVTRVTEPQYQRLCAAIGRDDLAADPVLRTSRNGPISPTNLYSRCAISS